jgi:hypothetical protein
VVAAALALVAVGVALIGFFTFDIGRASSRLADWHTMNSERYPRYYAMTDPFHWSTSKVYWRLTGVVFGGLALTFAGLIVIVR